NKNPLTVSARLEKTLLNPGENTQLILDLDLADKHIGYVDNFQVKAVEPQNMLVGAVTVSNSFNFKDKFTKLEKIGFKGKTQAFAVVELPTKLRSALESLKFEVIYQACTDDYCLLPKSVEVSAPVQMSVQKTST